MHSETGPLEREVGVAGRGALHPKPRGQNHELHFMGRSLDLSLTLPLPLSRQGRQRALKGTNLRGQTESKRRFSQIFADFCRFSPFPRKQSIWEMQIFAENR